MFTLGKYIKEFLDKINQYYCYFLDQQRIKYYVLEVNLKLQEVTLRIKGRSFLLKYAISEMVNESWIIEGLPHNHACWLGYFYGKSLRASYNGRLNLRKKNELSFLLKRSDSRYKIVFQNRNGEIGYKDCKTNKEYIEHPLAIAQNYYIIAKFDPIQACYIGILAGMSLEKMENNQNNVINLNRMRTQLRIVN